MDYRKATDPKEIRYINRRKRKAFFSSLCFYLCRIFPINNNLVSVCSFEGKGGFGCNPKYLVQEMHKRNPSYEFVWFVDNLEKPFPSYVRKVPNTLWSRAYWLSKSKVWIDNYRKPYGTVKRKGQYYLNVNHYTIGIKCTGLWRGEGFSEMAYLVSKSDSDMIDDLVIDSDWCEEVSPKGLVYSGTYLKTGAPRCDILYGTREDPKKRFRERYHLPNDAKVVMYAPTFREGAVDGVRRVYSAMWTLDFGRLIKTLEKKYGGMWYVCVRVHPQLASDFEEYKDKDLGNRLIDESHADDMYEILAGMDAFITDYSSACFEAGFAGMPVYIYADDIEQYTHDRGNLMWNFDINGLDQVHNNKVMTPDFEVEFPFPIATTNDALERKIMDYSFVEYSNKLKIFFEAINLVFNGKAGKNLADIIEQKLK